MHPTKSPGPDGMPALFFLIKNDVIKFCSEVLNEGTRLIKINTSNGIQVRNSLYLKNIKIVQILPGQYLVSYRK